MDEAMITKVALFRHRELRPKCYEDWEQEGCVCLPEVKRILKYADEVIAEEEHQQMIVDERDASYGF